MWRSRERDLGRDLLGGMEREIHRRGEKNLEKIYAQGIKEIPGCQSGEIIR